MIGPGSGRQPEADARAARDSWLRVVASAIEGAAQRTADDLAAGRTKIHDLPPGISALVWLGVAWGERSRQAEVDTLSRELDGAAALWGGDLNAEKQTR